MSLPPDRFLGRRLSIHRLRRPLGRQAGALMLMLALALSVGGCASDSGRKTGLAEAEGFWTRIFSPDSYKLYKPPIAQGNNSLLNEKNVRRVRPGMRRDQVAYLLGTPILPSAFRLNQWNYVYTLTPTQGQPTQRSLTLFFDDADILERICEKKRCRS